MPHSMEEAEEAENLSAWSKRAHTSLAVDRSDRPFERPAERTLERPERTERALVRGGGGGVVHPRARHIPPPPHLQAHLHPQHPAQHAKEAEERRNNEDEWKNINVVSSLDVAGPRPCPGCCSTAVGLRGCPSPAGTLLNDPMACRCSTAC